MRNKIKWMVEKIIIPEKKNMKNTMKMKKMMNDDPQKSYENTTFNLDPPEFKLVRKERPEQQSDPVQPETEETEEDMELSKLFGKYNITIKERDNSDR